MSTQAIQVAAQRMITHIVTEFQVFNNNNNSTNREVGEESIEGFPYQGPDFSAGPRPNFTIAPRHPPHWEYITAAGQVCHSLEPYGAEELRAEIRRPLRHSYTPRTKIT